jgi:hypothetical protein
VGEKGFVDMPQAHRQNSSAFSAAVISRGGAGYGSGGNRRSSSSSSSCSMKGSRRSVIADIRKYGREDSMFQLIRSLLWVVGIMHTCTKA